MNGPHVPGIACRTPNLHPGAQGIARVAVDDARARLVVTFMAPLRAPQHDYLRDARSYTLSGGQRLFPRVVRVDAPPASPPAMSDRTLDIALDIAGDFSVYTLTVSGPDIDPFFSSYKFRFRLACDDRFDCRPALPEADVTPELPVAIDYLAKDYASFRQALLEFIPTRLPAWTERSVADVGIMLLDVLAYTADSFSYVQDRIANEAFLATARERRSVAGHLALIGYQLDEGAAAHTWLQFTVTEVATITAQAPARVTTRPAIPDDAVIAFETIGDATLHPELNTIGLHTWGNARCCLPRTALSAELVGHFESLKAGDYLLFDDGHGRRDVVQLTEPPALGGGVPAPGGGEMLPLLTTVRWSVRTPLHHEYCLGDPSDPSAPTTIARGNLVPAAHGITVNEPTPDRPLAIQTGRRPRVRLNGAPLAHYDPGTPGLPATDGTAATGLASVSLRSVSSLELRVVGERWEQRATLLESGPTSQVFRVEIDDDGGATVVFGNGEFGLAPDSGAALSATYRVGGGAAGNVGADTLTQLADTRPSWFAAVTNPLPATGGRDLQSRADAIRVGPPRFHSSLVAVTAADYQRAAQEFVYNGRRPIQRATAVFRWLGSWLTVTLALDTTGGVVLTPEVRRELMNHLSARRLTGYDVDLVAAVHVPIELEVEVCTVPGFRGADVQQAILVALGNREIGGGRRGFFHPDNFSFGEHVYVSRLFDALMRVPGVKSASIVTLARLHAAHPERDTARNVRQGFLAIARGEIAQLDNDRNFPEHGTIAVRVAG